MKAKEKPWGAFCELFGATARNRVLEIFLEGWEIDNSLGNVAEESSLNRATVYNIAEGLLKRRILVPTRKVAKAQLYKLNLENKEVKVLIKAFDYVLRRIAKEVEKTYAQKALVR